MADPRSTSRHSERRVRSEARKIFDQLEKGLESWYLILGLALLGAPVGVWLWLWLGLDEVWYKAIGWGVGSVLAMTPIAGGAIVLVEGSKARHAIRLFDLRFPGGTERRKWAVALLSDFTPTTDGGRDFLAAIAPARADTFDGGDEPLPPTVNDFEDEIDSLSESESEPKSSNLMPGEPIPIDISADPDALIPLELPPEVVRKQRR